MKKIMYDEKKHFWDDPKCTCCGRKFERYDNALLLPDDGDPKIALCESCVDLKTFEVTLV